MWQTQLVVEATSLPFVLFESNPFSLLHCLWRTQQRGEFAALQQRALSGGTTGMEGSSYCFVPWGFKSFTVLRASAAGSKEGASLNMIPSKAGTSEFQSLLFPLLRWRGPADLHRPSLLKPPQMMKGILPTYTQPGFQSVMAHPKHLCSSSVEGMNLLRTPSEQQALGHRWATNILQKFEGKSPAFAVFCDLRWGSEGLQCDSGYLCLTTQGQHL